MRAVRLEDALASKGLNSIIRIGPRIGGIDMTGTVLKSAEHVESSGPGALLNQDTFCSPAFAKCYSSKMPIAACDLP